MKTRLALVLVAFGLFGWGIAASGEEVKKDAQTLTGVVIDAKCGGDKDEAKVAGHKKECVIACAKTGGLVLKSGDKTYKIADASKEKVLAYLKEDDAKTKVTIEGTVKDDTVTVESIKAAEEKKA